MVIIKVKANLSSTGTGLPTGTELGNKELSSDTKNACVKDTYLVVCSSKRTAGSSVQLGKELGSPRHLHCCQ